MHGFFGKTEEAERADHPFLVEPFEAKDGAEDRREHADKNVRAADQETDRNIGPGREPASGTRTRSDSSTKPAMTS